jgi:hypothetical protein
MRWLSLLVLTSGWSEGTVQRVQAVALLFAGGLPSLYVFLPQNEKTLRDLGKN